MKYITQFIAIAGLLYLFGFVFVMLSVMNGYQGGDVLSEHYRSVLQVIFR